MKNKLIIVSLFCLLISPIVLARLNIFKKNNHDDKKEVVSENVAENYEKSHEILAGEWIICKVGNTEIEREENYPYIQFHPNDDAFYASNGCNVLNGVYTFGEGNILMFHNVLSTLRYCVDTPFDVEINAILRDESRVWYREEIIDGEPFLYFNDANGKQLMTLHKPGLNILNGFWRVVRLEDDDTSSDDLTLFIDIEGRRLHCNAGCNSYNGNIFVVPQSKRTLSITDLSPIKKDNPCPDVELQSKLLVALERAAGAEIVDSERVELIDSYGKSLVILRKSGFNE